MPKIIKSRSPKQSASSSNVESSVSTILATRPNTHGEFTDNAVVMQVLKDTIRAGTGYRNTSLVQREALDMIAHKIGRIVTGDPNFHDHWDDIIGYAKLARDRIQK